MGSKFSSKSDKREEKDNQAKHSPSYLQLFPPNNNLLSPQSKDHFISKEKENPESNFQKQITVDEESNQNFKENRNIYHSSQCNYCNKEYFKGYRYKCFTCADYDICDSCFEKKLFSDNHTLSHPMLLLQETIKISQLEDIVIVGIKKVNQKCIEHKILHECKCDSCKVDKIPGIRFHCDFCLNYNLCFNCYEKENNKHNSHPLIAMIPPFNNNISFEEIQLIKVIREESFWKNYKAKYNGKVIECKIFEFNLISKKNQEESTLRLNINRTKNIYKELYSSHIIKYLGDSYENYSKTAEISSKIIICLEFMDGSLFDYLDKINTKLDYRKKFILCLDLISGIRKIHNKNLAHNSLKLDNIYLDGKMNYLKIGIGDLELDNDVNKIKLLQYEDIYKTGLIFNQIFTGTKNNDLKLKSDDLFSDVIKECRSSPPEKRSPATKIEDYFLKFDRYFLDKTTETEKNNKQSEFPYLENMLLSDKNEIFHEIYKEFLMENKF